MCLDCDPVVGVAEDSVPPRFPHARSTAAVVGASAAREMPPDRGKIVIICVSISLCLFRILLYIFFFLCFVIIYEKNGRKELKPE